MLRCDKFRIVLYSYSRDKHRCRRYEMHLRWVSSVLRAFLQYQEHHVSLVPRPTRDALPRSRHVASTAPRTQYHDKTGALRSHVPRYYKMARVTRQFWAPVRAERIAHLAASLGGCHLHSLCVSVSTRHPNKELDITKLDSRLVTLVPRSHFQPTTTPCL
jgi:hypothetical protein